MLKPLLMMETYVMHLWLCSYGVLFLEKKKIGKRNLRLDGNTYDACMVVLLGTYWTVEWIMTAMVVTCGREVGVYYFDSGVSTVYSGVGK